MLGRVSISQVAERAHCSIATVSNVLNNKGRVSKETRKTVLRAVRTLDYKTNSAGRTLRLRRTETFGLLFYPSCAQIFRNPFYAEVMEGLEERLTEAGYHLLLSGFRAASADFQEPDLLIRGKVDGMILLGGFPQQIVQNFSATKAPLLLLDSSAEWPVDSVISDGFSGELEVVRHLVARGHRRIVMLAYRMEDYNIDLRAQGFLAGLAQHGLEQAGAVIRDATFHDDLYPILLARLRGPNPPTAVVAVNDTLALAMIQRLARDGIRVPEHLSMIGYDDDVADAGEPPLTTVRVNRKELGRAGAELLLKRVTTPHAPVAKLRLPVELVVRESVAEIPPSL